MTSRRRRGDSCIILRVVIFLKSPFSILPLYQTPPGRAGGAFPLFCAFLIWPLLQSLQSHVHCVFVNISRMSHHPATQAHVTGIQLHSASLLPLFLLLRLTLSLPFPPLSFILSAFSPWFPAPHWILGEPSHRLLLFLCFSPTPRLLASTTSPRLLSWPCFGSD